MTQLERLVARIKKLCSEHPGSAISIVVIADSNGDPFMWMVGYISHLEGNDEKLIATGIKPAARKATPEGPNGSV